jgi:SAM-dependent methyltransferase
MNLVNRLLEHPRVYAAWQAPFVAEKFAPVERELRKRPARRVLDVGCGPGTNAARFAVAEYTGIDINERYLEQARSKHHGRFICADLETARLPDLGVFDTVVVNSFLHHLPDDAVHRVLTQVRERLSADGRVHILELVRPDTISLARVMAALDRGRFARSLASWSELFGAHFDAVITEPYTFGRGLWAMVYFQGQAPTCEYP